MCFFQVKGFVPSVNVKLLHSLFPFHPQFFVRSKVFLTGGFLRSEARSVLRLDLRAFWSTRGVRELSFTVSLLKAILKVFGDFCEESGCWQPGWKHLARTLDLYDFATFAEKSPSGFRSLSCAFVQPIYPRTNIDSSCGIAMARCIFLIGF